MTETLSPVVELPRMNAADAITLALALKTALHAAQPRTTDEAPARASRRADASAATGPTIPENVSACMTRMEACCARLTRARREGAAVSPEPAGGDRRSIFTRYKKAWSTLFTQVSVWIETDVVASLSAAQRTALDEVLVVGVTPETYSGTARRVWLDGRERLAAIKARGLAEVFTALGAEGVLAHVQRIHTQLAADLGVTAARPAKNTPSEVGDALTALQAVMREYVVKVHAMAEPSAPASGATVAALLAPFRELRMTARAGAVRAATKKKAAKKTTPVVDPAAKPANTGTDAARPVATEPTPLRPTGTG